MTYYIQRRGQGYLETVDIACEACARKIFNFNRDCIGWTQGCDRPFGSSSPHAGNRKLGPEISGKGLPQVAPRRAL